ncbi:hypothetical protein BS17DRAFT_779140 [Gyrodon lividus]|nr:hypothetical protein BS17DRAFT_779140 [Gyrodon lividus]
MHSPGHKRAPIIPACDAALADLIVILSPPYRKGLNAKQVALAARKYRGHRTLPVFLMTLRKVK